MVRKISRKELEKLPVEAGEFITQVIKKMQYRKKVRLEVMAELEAHFEDELRDCQTDEERGNKTRQLIEEFGDVKLLGVLLRRAKKRCRSMWQKVLIRSGQFIGLVILFIIIRIVCFSLGTATISTDYVKVLNDLVRAERNEEDNAKSYYDRAASLYIPPPKSIEEKHLTFHVATAGITNLNDVESEELVKWLSSNEAAFEKLKDGAQKPYYWRNYQRKKTATDATVSTVFNFSPIENYGKLARAIGWQVVYDTSAGRLSDAFENCLVLQKFGMHLQGQGFLAEQMVGVLIETIAQQRTFILSEGQDISVELLKNFHNKLKGLNNKKPVINLKPEGVGWYDLVQRGFTDDGEGSGRVLKNGLAFVISDAKSSLMNFFFFSYPDRRDVVKMLDGYFVKAEKLLEKTPWQLHIENNSQGWNEIGKKCFILKTLGPAYGKLGEKAWALKTSRTALMTVMAALLYKADKGEYPADLGELVTSGYLKELPMDPFSDRPLVYKKTDGDFLLYSVGLNFIDDGGEMGKDNKGKPRVWEVDGDTVFWPVE